VRIVAGAPDADTLQETELRQLQAKGCAHVLRGGLGVWSRVGSDAARRGGPASRLYDSSDERRGAAPCYGLPVVGSIAALGRVVPTQAAVAAKANMSTTAFRAKAICAI
jgi:hypothetical protein